MKYAWVENGIVRDVAQGTPSEIYHPDVAALYTAQVPDNAANGDSWNGTTLTKPVIPAPPSPTPVPPKVSPIQFLLLFTPQERVAIKAAGPGDPLVADLLSLVYDARVTEIDLALGSTQQALGYLEMRGLLTQGRVAAILTGVVT